MLSNRTVYKRKPVIGGTVLMGNSGVLNSWRSSAASPLCILSLIHIAIFYWFAQGKPGHVRKQVCVCGYLVCIHASQRGRVRAQCVYTRALHLISLRRVRTQTADVLAEPKYICSRNVYLYDECDTVALLRDVRRSRRRFPLLDVFSISRARSVISADVTDRRVCPHGSVYSKRRRSRKPFVK